MKLCRKGAGYAGHSMCRSDLECVDSDHGMTGHWDSRHEGEGAVGVRREDNRSCPSFSSSVSFQDFLGSLVDRRNFLTI